MKFGGNDKILDWHLLTKDEAEAYVYFLEQEGSRHQYEIEVLVGDIDATKSFHRPDDDVTPIIRLWASAVRRHTKDIIEIDYLVEMVKHWFKLNNKEGKK